MASFLKLYTPEGFLTFSNIFLLLFNSYYTNNFFFKFPLLNYEIFFQIFTISIITLLLLFNISFVNINYNFFFFNTLQIQNLKIVLLFIFLIIFITIWRSFTIQKLNFFEYFIILSFTITGLLFLINSYNLISIYLCLEIQALGFYILASFDRASLFSSEAGLKYFISSSLISGLFLLGSALIYGSVGTLNVYEISFLTYFFSDYFINFSYFFFSLGCFLILNTLLFKLVIAPYHFWFPQIYDGAPLSSTIVFSIIPKIAIINLFITFWSSVYNFLFFFNTFFFLVGIYSVFFGIFKMLKQTRLKKLYIYSSISNFGLILCLLIDITEDSTFSIFFYFIIYIITSILLWIIFIIIYYNHSKAPIILTSYSIFLTYFNTLFIQNKVFAMAICFVFFSLAAIPPFCGFLSKLYLFLILLKNLKYELSIFLIYIGILGSYYYIKFLKIICFENIVLNKQNQIKNFYFMAFFNIDSTIFSLLLFLLLFFFIHPHSLLNFFLFI